LGHLSISNRKAWQPNFPHIGKPALICIVDRTNPLDPVFQMR
jgi:hypothetical protein